MFHYERFRDSTEHLEDGETLRARLAEDGYLFLRGLLPRDAILAVRARLLNKAAEGGWLAPDLPAWVPWLLFSVFAAVSLIFFRKPLMERFKLNTKSGHKVDSIVGENALALEDIAPGALGKVELRGASWTAHNSGDRLIQRSERPKVERVEGLTLHIRN